MIKVPFITPRKSFRVNSQKQLIVIRPGCVQQIS